MCDRFLAAEMLVPVLEFKMERGHMETKNAEIAMVSIVHKVTNLITSMDFIQSEGSHSRIRNDTTRQAVLPCGFMTKKAVWSSGGSLSSWTLPCR